MNTGLIIGTLIIFTGLGFILYLIWKSRKTIEFIHKNELKSAREIHKKIHERK